MSRARIATVITHRRLRETAAAVRELVAAARRAGVTLRFTPEEAEKHQLVAGEIGRASCRERVCSVV